MAKRKTVTAATTAETTLPSAETAESIATDTGAEIVLGTNFTVIAKDANALLHAASLLVEADTPEKASIALDHNLRLWVAIKTVLQNEENTLDPTVKANLRNLADFVSTTTMEATQGTIEARKLVALSRINSHIAEGLLRGQQNRMIQERAYEIWEQEGRPDGQETDHWLRAEAEIAAMLGQR